MPKGIDRDELRELQLEYLADVREKLKLIVDQAESLGKRSTFKTAFPLLLFLSHQIKGSGGSLGFPRISEVADAMNSRLNEHLEEDSADRRTLADLSVTIHRLAEDLDGAVGVAEEHLKA